MFETIVKYLLSQTPRIKRICCRTVPDFQIRTYTNVTLMVPQNRKGRNACKLFYKVSTTLMLKWNKEYTNNNQQNITHHDEVGFIPRLNKCFNTCESINIMHLINKSKDTWPCQWMHKRPLTKSYITLW